LTCFSSDARLLGAETTLTSLSEESVLLAEQVRPQGLEQSPVLLQQHTGEQMETLRRETTSVLRCLSRSVLIILAMLLATAPALAAEVMVAVPDEINWVDVPGLPGIKVARLQGNPALRGPFTLRVKFPSNYRGMPHSHSDDRTVTVISGTWAEGFGTQFDPEKATAMPPGTFLIVPADQMHFDLVGAEETIVQISGTGPSKTTYFNPADDPANKQKQ